MMKRASTMDENTSVNCRRTERRGTNSRHVSLSRARRSLCSQEKGGEEELGNNNTKEHCSGARPWRQLRSIRKSLYTRTSTIFWTVCNTKYLFEFCFFSNLLIPPPVAPVANPMYCKSSVLG